MKDIFQVEYVLGKISQNVLWKALSTPDGLACWFADQVDTKENMFVFHWGKSIQNAVILSKKNNTLVRLHWEEEDPRFYFEIRMSVSELSGDAIIRITDFCESTSDMHDLTEWWNMKIESLRKSFGI